MILALKAAFLGVIQGLTEFIPVSSSGHLILVQRLFGWKDLGLAFDVALHLGTLIALIAYFRKEWIDVIKGFFSSFRRRPSTWSFKMRLSWMLILASIPAGVAGVLLENLVEKHLRTPAWVAMFLVAGTFVMLSAEAFGGMHRNFEEIGVIDAGSVSFAQVFSLFPGVSRSGITISAGMLRGFNREAAARFAFLLAAPAIAGAGFYEAADLAKHGMKGGMAGAFAAGFIASAVAGFIAIKYMLKYLRSGTLRPFIIYRVALAAVVFVVILVK